jgi:Capsule polysaccharide biosynthesis protein
LFYWEKFLEFESKNDLFQLEEDGIHVWDVLRHHVFVEYSWDNYIDQAPLKEPALRMLRRILRRAGYLIIFLFRKRRPNLFFIHSRDRTPDGRFLDRNANDLLERIGRDSFLLETFEGDGVRYAYPVDLINPASIFNRLYKLFYKNKDYSWLVDKINSELGLRWNNAIVNRHMRYFRSEGLFFKWVFRLKKIKRLYVSFHSQKSHYYAARLCGIESIEIQHGVMDYGHLDYNYPPEIVAGGKVHCPDLLLTYGAFWSREINYPVKKVLAIGNSIVSRIGRTERPLASGPLTLLFISADVFGVKLSELAIEYVQLHPGSTILFKLHPNQFSRRKEYLDRFRQYPAVRVLTNEQSTGDLMLHCDAVVLIQSTIAYEALQAGVPVFIYKRMTYFRHGHLFDHPNVSLIDDAQEIVLREKGTTAEGDIFFEEFDESVYLLIANTH